MDEMWYINDLRFRVNDLRYVGRNPPSGSTRSGRYTSSVAGRELHCSVEIPHNQGEHTMLVSISACTKI